MNNKVSIIVPVYHVAPYIRKCVESILTQTYSNIELILVDDGGDDECPVICDKFALKDDRVICIHKENSGQSFARRAGVSHATGDYFMFVDADDWLESTAIAESIEAAVAHNADVVCFGYKRVYEKKTFETPVLLGVDEVQIYENADVRTLQRRVIGLIGAELANVEAADRMAPMWGKLYKREVVAAGKWISEREVGSSEDALFNLYALSACRKFVYLNRFLYCYRKTNEQATTKRYRANLVQQWEVLFQYFQIFIDEANAPAEYTQALSNRVALSMLGIGLNELSSPQNFWRKAAVLRNVLRKNRWRNVYINLEFCYFPLKWNLFFKSCKYRQTEFLLTLLYLIGFLKRVIAH